MVFVKDVDTAVEALNEQINLLKKKADENMPVPEKIEKISSPWAGRYLQSEFEVQGAWSKKTPETIDLLEAKLKNALERVDLELSTVEKTHLENQPKIDNNKKIVGKIKLIMSSLGVKETYSTYEYKTSRSRNKTETKHIAGYIGDLNRVAQTSDGYDSVKRSAEEYKRKLETYADKLKGEIRAKEIEKAKVEKEKKSTMAKAMLIVKYGLEQDAQFYEIREAILLKDKYAALAYWLEKNRGDWSDGCDYAETGLNDFKVVTEEDKEIYDEIYGLCAEWSGDGRIFRDCRYNYSVLYSMASEEVNKDIQLLNELEEM